jgi:PAS domain-containing protein
MGSQKEIELILSRQLASYLSVPVFLVGTEGDLLFYNEAAEQVIGRSFEETGSMKLSEWTEVFHLADEEHRPLRPEEFPLVIALRERRPVHRTIWGSGFDGAGVLVQVTCLPVIGQAGRFLGAIAFFWETDA